MQKLVDQRTEEQRQLHDKHAEKISALEAKHSAEKREQLSKHSAEKKQLHSAHRADVLRMRAEKRQMKCDVKQYSKKVTESTTLWAEQLARQKEVVKKMQQKVDDLTRELSLSLAEESHAAAATSSFNPLMLFWLLRRT